MKPLPRGAEEAFVWFCLTLAARVAALALVWLFFLAVARAGEVSVDAGRCFYSTARDGTFYNSDKETHNNLDPACASLAWSSRRRDRGYEISYHSFGGVKIGPNTVNVRDQDFGKPAQPCLQGPGSSPADRSSGWAGCLSRMTGAWRVYGINLALTSEKCSGRLCALAKGGLLFYDVRGWAANTFYQNDGSTAEANTHSGMWNRPAPMLGACVKYGIARACVEEWFAFNEHRALTVFGGTLRRVSVGIAGAF